MKESKEDNSRKKSDSPKAAVKSTKSDVSDKAPKTSSLRYVHKSRENDKQKRFADGKTELKRQFIKKKAEARQQSEQGREENENYAADTVETSAYRSAETVRRDAKTAARKIAGLSRKNNDSSIDDGKAEISVKDERNMPKTAENYRSSRLKTRNEPNNAAAQQAVRVKSAEINAAKRNSDVIIQNNPIKTAENYRGGITTPKTKQSIYPAVTQNRKRDIKTKTAYVSDHSGPDLKSETAKAIMRRQAAIKAKSSKMDHTSSEDNHAEITEIVETPPAAYNVNSNSAPTVQPRKAEQDPIKQKSATVKYIKTKENYLNIRGESGGIKSVSILPKVRIDNSPKSDTIVHEMTQAETVSPKTKERYIQGRSANGEHISEIQTARKSVGQSFSENRKYDAAHNAEDKNISSEKNFFDKGEAYQGSKPETDIYGQPEIVVQSNIPESDGPSVRIKTKEYYLSEHSTNGVSIKTAAGSDLKAPKQNSHIIYHSREYTEKHESTVQPKTAAQAKGIKNIKDRNITRRKEVSSASANDKAKIFYMKRARQKAAQRSSRMAKETAQTVGNSVKSVSSKTKNVSKAAVKVGKAISGAAKSLIAILSAAGGGIALIIALAVIIIITAVAASPFGIYISGEVDDPNNISVSSIIAEANNEFSNLLDELEHADTYTQIITEGEQADWTEVLAVFAAKYADMDSEDFMDVVIIDEHKKELLLEVFRDMNYVEYTIETITTPSGAPEAPPIVEKKLFIEIKSKTAAEMADEYEFSDKQREILDMLLEDREAFSDVTRSLAISDASAAEVVRALPSDLELSRKNVVKAACSLVGEVNYFWDGKSETLGWDTEWGKMRRVTASGSSSTGTTRPYGLDCSGFVTWAFVNSGISSNSIGHGTVSQNANCSRILWRDAKPGDLAFYADLSHVGIVAGRDADGNVLVIHCSSGRNNVVITSNSGFGFAARPRCY